MARRQSPAAISAGAQGQAVAVRERLFELAGLDLVEQAAITRRIIDKFCQLMSARKVQRLVVNTGLHQSDVVEYIDEDGALQVRAASELRDILGLAPSKTTTGSGPGTALQVNVTLVQPPDVPRKVKGVAQVVDVTPVSHNGALRAPQSDVS
jgi:hypothetical protein